MGGFETESVELIPNHSKSHMLIFCFFFCLFTVKTLALASSHSFAEKKTVCRSDF